MPETAIWCDDFTDFMGHQSRSWTASDMSLAWAGGVQWLAAGVAAAAAAAAGLLSGLLLAALGSSILWGTLLTPVAFIPVYLLMSKDRDGSVRTLDLYRLRLNFHLRQPRYLSGLHRNDDPTDVHWHILLWEPDWPEVTPI